jgi:hypothetical protein
VAAIREHPGSEAEPHSEAFRDGSGVAYDPFQTPEARSRRMQKLGVIVFFVLLPFAVAGAVILRRRRVGIWIVTIPFVVVSITALASYGSMRFRAPAGSCPWSYWPPSMLTPTGGRRPDRLAGGGAVA